MRFCSFPDVVQQGLNHPAMVSLASVQGGQIGRYAGIPHNPKQDVGDIDNDPVVIANRFPVNAQAP